MRDYNPATNLNDPETLGLFSGYYYDGSPVYPGTGFFNCGNPIQNPAPARIETTNNTLSGPGSVNVHVTYKIIALEKSVNATLVTKKLI